MTTPIPRTPLAPIKEVAEPPRKPTRKTNDAFALDSDRIKRLSDAFRRHHRYLMDEPPLTSAESINTAGTPVYMPKK